MTPFEVLTISETFYYFFLRNSCVCIYFAIIRSMSFFPLKRALKVKDNVFLIVKA